MKVLAKRRISAILIAISVALTLFFGASVFSVGAIKTSESISELGAVYSYTDPADIVGTITTDALFENVDPEEFVMFNVYQSVNDISDPSNGRTNLQTVTKGFYARSLINGSHINIVLPHTPLKLNGKCVLGVQVSNRGEVNDWVYTYITTALKIEPNGGVLTGEGEKQVKLGFSILDEIEGTDLVSRDYYNLVGWSTEPDGERIGADHLMSQYGDTIYAIWERLKTTVTFDANGAFGTMNPVTCNLGEEYTLPDNAFVKPGYEFVGWGKTPGGPAVYENGQTVVFTEEGPADLFAIWKEAEHYNVYFRPNGGEGVMEVQNVEANVATTLNPNVFTRGGYKFIGWSTQEDGEVEYEDCAPVTLTAEDLTLWAVWKQNNTAVYYSPNGGEGLMLPHRMDPDTTTNLDANSYTHKGNKFLGWATSPNGPVVYTDGQEFTIGEKSVVLYAVWEHEDRAVLYSPNGGTGYMAPHMELSTGVTVELRPNLFVKKGCTFAGWSLVPDGEIAYQDRGVYVPGDKNIVLYAVWAQD